METIRKIYSKKTDLKKAIANFQKEFALSKNVVVYHFYTQHTLVLLTNGQGEKDENIKKI